MDGIGFPLTCPVENDLPSGQHYCISQLSKLQHPPGTPWAFQTFAILGEGNLIISLPGGGECKPQPRFYVTFLIAL